MVLNMVFTNFNASESDDENRERFGENKRRKTENKKSY